MHAMVRHPRRCPLRKRPPGRGAAAFTLVEVLIVVAILATLTGLLIVAASAVRGSMRKNQAESQLSILAGAIEQYTQAWRPWRHPDTNAVIAAKGWPDWSGWRLFATPGNPQYSGQFNFDPSPTPINGAPQRWLDLNDPDSAEFTGECLAYCLTAESGGGPFLKEPPMDLYKRHDAKFYPIRPIDDPNLRQSRAELLDPWYRDDDNDGEPDNSYRYFWVARDGGSETGWRAITSADPAQAVDPGLGLGDPFFWRAEGYVIESAGPDGRFGNIWKPNPTSQEKLEAEDNLWVRP